MLEIAVTLFNAVSGLFACKVPGLNISFFTLFVGIIVIDIVIRTVFIILGVSSGTDDLPASMIYDSLSDNEMLGLAPRSKRWQINRERIDSDSVYLAGQTIKSKAKHWYVKTTPKTMTNKISIGRSSATIPYYLLRKHNK